MVVGAVGALGSRLDVVGSAAVQEWPEMASWEERDWEDDSWRDQAACRATAAELFFPSGRTPGASEAVRTAKSVCRSCDVRQACLMYALETNQDSGIWGGTSEDERRKMRRAWLARRRRVRPAGTLNRAPEAGT
jgi:WhiB family transcriptional regulator, redox-sensing transcriptional regulator